MDKGKLPDNNILNEEKAEQEGYAFLQEVIKDETVNPKVIKRKVLQTVGCGILFGIVVSVVVAFLSPITMSYFGGSTQTVNIDVADESVIEEAEESEDDSSKENEDEKTENNVAEQEDEYFHVLQTLNAVAVQKRKSLVSLIVTSEKENAVEESGVVIADNGKQYLILSSQMKKGKDMKAILSDGKSYKATAVQMDSVLELGIYAIEKSSIKSKGSVEVCSVGNSEVVKTGDPVIVLGHTKRGDFLSTYGLSLANAGTVELPDGVYRLLSSNVQIEDLDNGVILDKTGSLIGVIKQSVLGEAGDTRVGGYAISDIKDIVELLSNDIPVPYVGVYGMDIEESLMEKGMPKGLYVKEVAADSPAMEAGLQSGDIISEVDGILVTDMLSYMSAIGRIEDKKQLKIIASRRNGEGSFEEMEFIVTVGKR